jgi:hypothetical protein
MVMPHGQLRIAFGTAIAVVALAWTPDAGRANAPKPALDRFVGVYRFVGGPKEVREVERAIDDAVDELNVLIRGIARRRLEEPNLPTDELRISVDGDSITIARSGQPEISAPTTGRVVTWENPDNGNELRVAHVVVKDGRLEQRLIGDRGVSKNVFALARDGRLTVQTTIDADKLPSTIRFSTTYARQSTSSRPR